MMAMMRMLRQYLDLGADLVDKLVLLGERLVVRGGYDGSACQPVEISP